MRFMLTVLCNVMLRRVPCYGCVFCASLCDTGSKVCGRIFVPFIRLRTETCLSVFNVLMCRFYKFYICAVVGVMIE